MDLYVKNILATEVLDGAEIYGAHYKIISIINNLSHPIGIDSKQSDHDSPIKKAHALHGLFL